jgi:hypothetical protein
MYVLIQKYVDVHIIKKTCILSWKICKFGLKNTILDTYVHNTYDLKNMVRRQGWTVIDGHQWMEGLDGCWTKLWRTTTNGDVDVDEIATDGDGRQLWRMATMTDDDCDELG